MAVRQAIERFVLGATLILAAVTVRAQDQSPSLVPDGAVLGDSARTALQAAWLTDAERAELRVFHGVWDERDLDRVEHRAAVRLNAWQLDDPIFDDQRTPIELRAEARLRRGDLAEAVALLEGVESSTAARITAQALDRLGDGEGARRAAAVAIERAADDDPAAQVASVRATAVRAKIDGKPGRDYQSMMGQLARARQELDQLFWPARLAEAELLLEKYNEDQAIEALHETLSLNPRCAEAWFLLGQIALDRFDFASVQLAADALRRLDADHPLATLLLAESRLIQDDPDGAMELLDPLVARWPRLREAHELVAAAQALYYDDVALQAALARAEELSPGGASVYFVVGRHLSFNRQYGAAAEMLEEAIRRRPAWPAPQIELGLMELQSGRDDRALAALQRVAEIDPFNKRAANSLFLLEELADYARIESPHFIVRFKPGIDEVMAEMMLEQLERIHETVSSRFDYEPDRKTIIELMPDHKRFAVRITGMPFIHTIAACTGPVIAMEVPREGNPREHLGLFDWPRVIQHEYTHTITLGQTQNRIPHWLTEAAAVSMEQAPRPYETAMMLARSYEQGTLFDLDEIKWAFVRPKRPGDRSKAYAQGHWMVEFMNERFGESALVRLLGRYFDGEREQEAIPNALGVSRQAFFEDFLDWAGDQVVAWGLAAEPSVRELTDAIRWADPELAAAMETSQQARLDIIAKMLARQVGVPSSSRAEPLSGKRWPPLMRPPVDVTEEALFEWRAEYPDHPDLIELQLRRLLAEEAADASIIALLERYADVRPVDPYPHKKLAQIYLAGDDPTLAIPHLEALDRLEEKTPVYAVQLARLYRDSGEMDRAVEKATRALHINPYHAPNRELAAAIALEAGRVEEARRHIVALTLIEPDRPQHTKRLGAIDRLLDRRRGEGG